ncbi:tetratricopeptide repeat protein [Myxococcota bacterium]|nr:tetratricopeptide repeat protein [Myxococcota bacterium]
MAGLLRLSPLRRLLARPSDAALEGLARQDRGPRPDPLPPPTTGLQAARRAFAEGRHAEALHLYGELLAHDAHNAWAWHGRGDALLLLGQPSDARAAYARAAELAPTEGLHLGGLANALSALGHAEPAAEQWRRALALDPGLTWMRDGRAPPR